MNASQVETAISQDPEGESRQAGITLLEVGMALLVTVFVIIGILALFGGIFSTSKVTNETNYLTSLAGNVENTYGTNHNYGTSDLTAGLVSTKNAPAPMIVGTGLVNSWGGAVTVTGANQFFTLQETNVPQKECIQLAQTGSVSPSAISINGTAQTLPLTSAAAAAGCTSATANTILWQLN